MWCWEHERFEYPKLSCQLVMQLGSGFLNFDDWVYLISSLKDKTQRVGKAPGINGTAYPFHLNLRR